MTRLYTDQLGDNWNAFLSNILMRSFLKHGIDVLYLNDSVFQRLISSRCKNFPSKQQLEELIELVKPLKICNHFGEFKKSLY